MKKKLLLASLLLGLTVLGHSQPGLAGSSIPADLLAQLEKEGWTEIRPGVLQRDLGGNRIETLGFGVEGLRFQIAEMKAQLQVLKQELASHPSRDLRITVRAHRAQIRRLEAGLREATASKELASSHEAVLSAGDGCRADYDATADASPLTQGAGATASTYFYNACGYTAEVYVTTTSRATRADGAIATLSKADPTTASNPPRTGGSVKASAAVGVNGVQDCFSQAYASVTTYDLGIAYSQTDTNSECSAAGGAFPFPRNASSLDIGVTGVAGSTSFANGKFTVTAGGTDLWETHDDFRFVYQDLTGDGEIVANVTGLTLPAGAATTLGGIMFRESLTPDSVHATMMITTDGKAKFRRRTTTGGTTLSDGPSIGTTYPPRWLKLVRSGNVFTAYLSTDGAAWTQVHTPQTVPMPATVHVGLVALRSGSTAPAGQATFEQVSFRPLPSPWQTTDIGPMDLLGKASSSGGLWTIEGSGSDLWDASDGFRYVYQPLFGDGEIVANVTGLTVPAGATRSQAAVMIREKLTTDSVHASMMVSTDGKAKFRRRTTEGDITWSDGPSIGTTYPPRWLRLTRAGNVFTAYLSTDGVNWTQVHTPQTVAMPANVWIGFAVLRDGDAPPATATIRDVQVVP